MARSGLTSSDSLGRGPAGYARGMNRAEPLSNRRPG
jgi:hypothetical protein